MKLFLTLALVASVLVGVAVAGNTEKASPNVDTDSIDDDSDDDDCEPEPPIPKCTRPNEVYEICPAPCPYRTCGIDDRLVKCAAPEKCPKSKCRCKSGFFRDRNQNCVRWEKCNTTCTGVNEIYDPCDNPCPARRCDFDSSVVRCKSPPEIGDEECLIGCRCQDGYLRNKQNVCVPQDQCPKKCKANEVYDPCPDCSPQTCSTVGQIFHCPMIPSNTTDPRCKGACRCQKGFARNDAGECIPIASCPKQCKTNEVYDPCPDCSPQTCSTIGQEFNCPLLPADKNDPRCKPACRCQKGFLRDNNGDCVPEQNCNKCTGKNQVYDLCPDCSPQTCETKDKIYHCPLIKCTPACRCKKGYFKNKIGDCISSEDCDKCKGPHEFWSCGSACDNRCDSKYGQNNCNIINIRCNDKCYCEDGYARATNGTCIPKKDCQFECPVNERYEKCPATLCGPKKCSDAGFPTAPCPEQKEPCPGKPGCVCNDGYLRNDKGVCVPTSECPSCGGDKNSTLGCGVNCGRLCSNYKRKDIACILICYTNACDCREGYVYDSNIKKCVLPNDCTPVCKKNEVFSTCINGGCNKKKCTDLNKPKICVHPKECQVGCLCADGYLRAKNGTCVPTEQCDVPLPQCKANEEFLKCGLDGCKKRYCSDLELPPVCRDTFSCDPGCECKEGFLRASFTNDTCVAVSQCPPVSCNGDKNAKPGCGVHCGNRCSNYKSAGVIACPAICNLDGCDCKEGFVYDDNTKLCVKPEDCTPTCGVNEQYSDCSNGLCRVQDCAERGKSRPCPPMVPGSCIKGCVCPEKFLRSKNGTCVPEDQCDVPPEPTCPKNEIYVKCPESYCEPQTCKQAGFPAPCPTIGPDGKCPGKPRCICQSGYLRNDAGICVPKNQCPSCGNDKNAIPGCGVNCGRLCSNYNSTKKPFCPLFCNLFGCDCKPGFVFDGNRKKCVLPENCTPTCQPTEVFSECANGLCRAQKCSQKGKPVPCPKVICKAGCVCPPKFLRAANGTCIPEDQCNNGGTPTCPVNEEYSTCSNAICRNQKCSQKGLPVACPSVTGCDKGCVCKENYLRNSSGKCVPEDQCEPQPTCPENEEYSTCSNAICRNQKCTQKGLPVACPSVSSCDKGCVCKENYLRNSCGKCVPEDQCEPQPTCPENEEYSTCSNAICRNQKCTQKGLPVACPSVTSCDKGCVCKENYLRDANGKCVPENQCDPTCPQGEVYDKCPPPQCDAEYCPESRYNSQSCRYPNNNSTNCSKPRCVCGFNSHRDRKTGKCIATSSCPPLNCGGPNEHPYNCGAGCPGDKCIDYLNNATCPRFRIGIVVPCTLGCRCNTGYYRDYRNLCIPGPECNKDNTCPENESYVQCPAATCTPQTCDQAGYPVACPRIAGNCTGSAQCLCKNGKLRNSAGVCVPKDQCPSCGGDKNAIPGCGVNCGKRCSTYKVKKPICPLFCNINGCDCKKGYVYDDNRQKCVLPRDCTPTCQPTEVFDDCANALCRHQNCADKDKPLACPKVAEGSCVAACVCPENYLRASNGTCIPQDQCATSGQCDPDTTTEPPTYTCDAEAQQLAITKGNSATTGKMLYQIAKNNAGKSVFMSGFSALVPLAELCLYSNGSTFSQLASAINVQSKSDVRCGFPGIIDSIQGGNGTILEVASKIYVTDEGKLSKSLEDDSENIFNAKAESIDFKDTSAASNTINKWVSDVTRGKINKLVDDGSLNPSTRLALINALYFKGQWKKQFDANKTQPRDFYVSNDKTIQVPTMTQKGKFNYGETSDYQVVELKFNPESISLVAILPKQKDGLLALLEKLQDPQEIENTYNSLSEETVTIYLPKIPSIETSIDLKAVLEACGVVDVFDPDKAQLNGMIEPNEDLFVTKAVMKGFVTIDETGAEAAVASGVFVGPTSPGPAPIQFVFNADHAFAFFIKHDDLILFAGTYNS